MEVILVVSTKIISAGDALYNPYPHVLLVVVFLELHTFFMLLFSTDLLLLILLPPYWCIWFFNWFILVSILATISFNWTLSSCENVTVVRFQCLLFSTLFGTFPLYDLPPGKLRQFLLNLMLVIFRWYVVSWPVVSNLENIFVVNWFYVALPI